MKRIPLLSLLFILGAALFAHAQRCGVDEFRKEMENRLPAFKQNFEQARTSINEHALSTRVQRRTQTTSQTAPIPVVFHILVTETQYQQMGGKWGVEERCRSQIAVLNEDFNHKNFDSSLVPSLWQPLYANVGLQFGLAHTDPNGYPTPGYTIRLTSRQGMCCMGSSFDSAKFTAYGGSDAWDPTRYVNVWCINFDDPAAMGLLGITLPVSMAVNSGIPMSNVGICILYNALGRRSDTSQSFPFNGSDANYYDLGRTVTHEMGHMFEIWHVWGDDGGACPWDPFGRSVLPDIPPQANWTLTNPVYDIPGGTIHDACKDSALVPVQPIGIACLDFMDYTDDQGMHLFTPDQASVMRSMALDSAGESYSLTQHPELLQWPVDAPQMGGLFPNPTSGIVTFYYDDLENLLLTTEIYNVLGKRLEVVQNQTTNGIVQYDLSGLPPGLYIFRLRFQQGIVTEKIVLAAK
jgi:Secretion system C-terminal sorting domain